MLFLWALFYYRIARNMTANAPISFSLLTVLTPVAGVAVIAVSTRATGAANTVQVHLKRIYRKTGAAGRFALSALIRGG